MRPFGVVADLGGALDGRDLFHGARRRRMVDVMSGRFDGITIYGHWDEPHLVVQCGRCLDDAQEHALFARPSTCVVGAVDPCIYPPWGDDDAVARYRVWLTEFGHWEIVGQGLTGPSNPLPDTFQALVDLVIDHEIRYH
jgi:hypothetical protein